VPELSEAEAGETEIVTGVVVVVGATTVTNAVAVCVGSAALWAVTVTDVLLVTLGAVKRPSAEIVPKVVNQVTAVLLVPWMVAVNCWAAVEARVRLVGEIATLIFEVWLFPCILIEARSFVEVPVESVTVIEKARVIGQSGVPLICPVCVFRSIFRGNVPRVTEKL
jgi:hypothetical protein